MIIGELHKVCKICNLIKLKTDYNLAGKGKWLQPYCKKCDSIRKKQFYIKNRERLIEKSKQNYLKTRVLLTEDERRKSDTIRNEMLRKNAKIYQDKIRLSPEEKKKRKSESDKKYRIKNYEDIKKRKKEYYDLKGNEQAKAWQSRQKNNIEFITKKRLRGRIYVALKRGIKSQRTMELLGCSIEQFKNYFESLFTGGMTWSAYLSGEIHIDHIIPCKKFDLKDPEQQKKCFNYKNLQPLWKLDNLKKSTK